MRTLEIFEVRVIADCEGRRTKVIAHFSCEEDANKFVNTPGGKDMYGHPGSVRGVNLTIYQSISEAVNNYSTKTIEQALAKLTEEEKELLGL